jgi:hypothetical protein
VICRYVVVRLGRLIKFRQRRKITQNDSNHAQTNFIDKKEWQNSLFFYVRQNIGFFFTILGIFLPSK